jgi:hypothetical protein
MLLVALASGSLVGCPNPTISATPIHPDGAFSQDAGTVVISDGNGNALQQFPPGGPPNPGAGGIWVTISGESNAITGYPFPPYDWSADTYMFDGWQFNIEAYIVVVGKVVLSSDPNLSATDQSLHGPQVAHLDGTYVVDLHLGGNIIGQGGGQEQATALGVIVNQNDNGGDPFDPTLTYGFGFSTLPATYAATNVNLTSEENEDYAYMVAHGASVYYRGTAVWNGAKSTYACTQTTAGGGQDAGVVKADGGYDFSRMPESGMKFRFAFSTPTDYVNCQNFTAQGMGVGGESSPRGIQVSNSSGVFAQVTVHMDHPFWESFAEDSPVVWDQIAAQYVGVVPPDGGIESHLEDFMGVPFQGFVDHTGTPIPWRSCSNPTYYSPPGNGQMSFSTLSVPVDPHGTDPSKAIRDYYDYIRYTQSTQGHLNSQGLCYIERQFPSPAGGS